MPGLTVQNFVSAATGMAVIIVLIFALTRRDMHCIGNIWVLLLRSIWVLLPLVIIVSVLLVSQGTVWMFSGPTEIELIDSVLDENWHLITDTQTIAMGVNSAHSLENPAPFSNFIEILSLILIPAVLCYTFGRHDRIGSKKGLAILLVISLILLPMLGICFLAEQGGNPMFYNFGVDQTASGLHPGGNMEGKEMRFDITGSSLFAVATTGISYGGVNSMHDSYTPIGGMVPLMLMLFGEIVFGGVGSCLYVMIVFVIVARCSSQGLWLAERLSI